MPLITSVTAEFNSTTLAVAICLAEHCDWRSMSGAEFQVRIDVCQTALDDLAARGILKVG
jgi:hypothetical protein